MTGVNFNTGLEDKGTKRPQRKAVRFVRFVGLMQHNRQSMKTFTVH